MDLCPTWSNNYVARYYYLCLGSKGLLPLLCPGQTLTIPKDAFWFSADLCFVCGPLLGFIQWRRKNTGLGGQKIWFRVPSSTDEISTLGENSLFCPSLSFLICQVAHSPGLTDKV